MQSPEKLTSFFLLGIYVLNKIDGVPVTGSPDDSRTVYTHVSHIILWNSNFTRQVDDNPTTGPDKSTRKILVDKSTTADRTEVATHDCNNNYMNMINDK